MTAQEWIARFAAELEVEAPDPATFNTLLELAAEAAHSSERTAAPVACYLVGAADVSLGDALAIAARVAPAD